MPRKEEYWKNPEKYRRAVLEWQKKNPKKKNAKGRRWRETHKEECRQYHREYRQRPEVKERRRLKQKEWRAKHPNANSAHHIVARHCELDIKCELCPDEDKNTEKLLAHHFAGYDYPKIFVTVCQQCHNWIHKAI